MDNNFVTHTQLDDLLTKLCGKIGETLYEKISPLQKRIAALEARPKGLRYRGTWNGVDEYATDDMTTHAGQLWYCLQPTKSRPGEDSTWKLMQKSEGAR